MKEFIVNLYSNENFPMYLGIFIIILVIAFVVVFFLGKKDQKLIETGKLKKLELDETKPLKPVEEEIEQRKAESFMPSDELPLDLPQKEYTDAFEMDNQIDTLELDLPKIKAAYRPENANFEYTKTLELPRLNSNKKKIEAVDVKDYASLADSISKELDSIEDYQKNIKNNDFVDAMYEEETLELDLPKLVNNKKAQNIDTKHLDDNQDIDLPRAKK